MELNDFIRPDRCIMLQNHRKNEALLELIEIIANQKAVRDVEELKKEIFYREQLMSTGIGLSIAVPHVRFGGADTPIVVIGVQPEGVTDYESLDEQTIKIVVMIVVAKDHHREYIRLLSIIMSRLKDENVREQLIAAKDSDTIASILRNQ